MRQKAFIRLQMDCDLRVSRFLRNLYRERKQQHQTSAPRIAEVAAGSFKQKNPPQIVGSGYVVRSLEAALWAFYRSNTFEKGALLAANLGDDADTTAAIFGQLGGAFYGAEAIPKSWLERLAMHDVIRRLADALLNLSQTASQNMSPE